MSTVSTPPLVIERRASLATHIEEAAKCGADGVAISVHLTADGLCVVGDWAAKRSELDAMSLLDAVELIVARGLYVVAAVEQPSIAGYVASLLAKRLPPQLTLLASWASKALDSARSVAPSVPTGLRVRVSHEPSSAVHAAHAHGATVLVAHGLSVARAAAEAGPLIRTLVLVREGDDIASLLGDEGCAGVITSQVPAALALRDQLRRSVPRRTPT